MTARIAIGKWSSLMAAAAVGLLIVATASPAGADEWLVVPLAEEGDVYTLEPNIRTLIEVLNQRGITTLYGAGAAVRFEAQVSARPPTLEHVDLAAWQERSKKALETLARNDYQGALGELEQAQAFSRTAVAELNRNEAAARTLLDTCLYTVRALLAVGKRATARVQAEECARLSPGMDANVKMHPPDVRTFYEDVVDAGHSTAGALVVESEPPQCAVRINGVHFGMTPVRVERLTKGRYAVQVECGEQRGRIHVIGVERGETTLRVDAGLDAAVRTDGPLRLSYPDPDAVEQAQGDARALLEALEVDAALLVSVHADDDIALSLVSPGDGEPRHTLAATTPADPSRDALGRALDVLLGVGRHATIPTRPPHGQFVAGVTLASIGMASLATSYALYGVRSTKQADAMIASPTNDNQARWLNTRTGMFFTGAIGATSLTTAMPLVLPYRRKTPWWAWLSGGAGLVLAGTSIALAVTAPVAPDVSRVANPQGYVDRDKRTDGAFLAGVTAAPLLTIPLVYVLRRDGHTSGKLAPRVVVHRGGAYLGVEGHY